jgi:hypothetical protein
MRSLKPFLRTLLVTSALGLSLGACREDELLRGAAAALPATMALQGYPQGVYDPYADPYGRVPIGRPVSYDDAWAWGERSYALDRAFYQTPPDYGFEYDGYEPWVWQTDDRWAMYADPYRDDDYRYYYYEPGDIRPYFIRDDQYGYGFDDAGRLVVMYDLLGRLMPQSLMYQQDPYATDYYRRAYMLRQASLQAQPIVVTREVWVVQQPIIVEDQTRWIQAATTQEPWVQYRTKTKDRFVRAFDDERRRREPTLTVASQDRGFLGLPIGRERTQAPDRVARLDKGVRGYPEPVTPGNGAAPSQAPKGRARAELRGQPGLDEAAARQALAEQRRSEQRQAQDQQRAAQRLQVEQRQAEQRQVRRAEEGRQITRQEARQRQEVDRKQQQALEQGRQQQMAQRQAREEARQQQAQRQAHEQARELARQQQMAQQQAREEARQQQAQRQAQQQAREQARQQQMAHEQAREQARQQQQVQQQAREQARQQQQAQIQMQQQARAQEQQAREQARQQQQAQQQARAQEQQAQQPRGRNAADDGAGQAPAEHGKGKGHK